MSSADALVVVMLVFENQRIKILILCGTKKLAY